MSNLITVAYDCSLFGLGVARPEVRTGIHRVVEELAMQLAQSDECRLRLCATNWRDDTWRYLQREPKLAGIAFRLSFKDKVNSSLRRAYADRDNHRGGPGTAIRIAMLHRAAEALAAAKDDDLILRSANVFHSPFLAVEPRIRCYASLKVFQTVYDLIPLKHPEWFKPDQVNTFEQMINGIRETDWVVTDSESTKADLCEFRDIDPERVTVTPLAADAGRFHPCDDPAEIDRVREKYRIPPGAYVLSVCTLEPRKNLDMVIRSFIDVVKDGKIEDLNLVLAGGRGWNNEALFAAMKSAPELAGRIITTGFVDDADLASMYSGALAFVYPSLYEGFGLPPLEAMQCGVPVITSNNSSLPEVVGTAGIMVDATDQDALSEATRRLINDSDLRADMSRRSLDRARLFSWKRCADDTIAAYYRAVNSG